MSVFKGPTKRKMSQKQTALLQESRFHEFNLSPRDVSASSQVEVGWHRVVEEKEVHSIEVVQLLLVEWADVVEELGGHVSCSPGALGRGGEADLVIHPCQL